MNTVDQTCGDIRLRMSICLQTSIGCACLKLCNPNNKHRYKIHTTEQAGAVVENRMWAPKQWPSRRQAKCGQLPTQVTSPTKLLQNICSMYVVLPLKDRILTNTFIPKFLTPSLLLMAIAQCQPKQFDQIIIVFFFLKYHGLHLRIHNNRSCC